MPETGYLTPQQHWNSHQAEAVAKSQVKVWFISPPMSPYHWGLGEKAGMNWGNEGKILGQVKCTTCIWFWPPCFEQTNDQLCIFCISREGDLNSHIHNNPMLVQVKKSYPLKPCSEGRWRRSCGWKTWPDVGSAQCGGSDPLLLEHPLSCMYRNTVHKTCRCTYMLAHMHASTHTHTHTHTHHTHTTHKLNLSDFNVVQVTSGVSQSKF